MKIADPRITFFDTLAERWDQEEPSAEAMTAKMEQYAEMLALRTGQSLLEVGCGTGKITAWLAAQIAPGRVTAVDFAPRMIAAAKAKGIDADFACMDVCSDDLAPRRFDVILCFHSFPHFRDQPAALRRLSDVLKPGGRLIVMHMAGSDHINHFHAHINGPVNGDILPTGEAWTPLLASAGLKLVTQIDRENLFFIHAEHEQR